MDSTHSNKFLEKFAQPVALHRILPITEPKAILLEAHTILEELDNNIEFVIYKEFPNRKFKRIKNQAIIEKILAMLEKVYEIDIARNLISKEISHSKIIDINTHEFVGNLKINIKS